MKTANENSKIAFRAAVKWRDSSMLAAVRYFFRNRWKSEKRSGTNIRLALMLAQANDVASTVSRWLVRAESSGVLSAWLWRGEAKRRAQAASARILREERRGISVTAAPGRRAIGSGRRKQRSTEEENDLEGNALSWCEEMMKRKRERRCCARAYSLLLSPVTLKKEARRLNIRGKEG